MSATSTDGLVILNPLTDLTLRASAESTAITAVAAVEVSGFGGFSKILFELAVTAVSLTGGSAPTAQLRVWVQRKTPQGQWDDLLALQTATMLSAAAALYHVAEYPGPVAAGPTPALVQDAGGAPPFAPRGGWISDALRAKAIIIVTGAPTAQSVTWALYARGRA